MTNIFSILVKLSLHTQLMDPACSCPPNYFLNGNNKCQCVAFALCSSGRRWNSDQCRCVTVDLCEQEPCPLGQGWNSILCTCVPLCGIEDTCPIGQRWDANQCRCVPISCGMEEICPIGQRWDTNQCRCVSIYCALGPVECSSGTVFSPDLCTCIPKPH